MIKAKTSFTEEYTNSSDMSCGELAMLISGVHQGSVVMKTGTNQLVVLSDWAAGKELIECELVRKFNIGESVTLTQDYDDVPF